MIKHIVAWQIKEEYKDREKEIKADIKKHIEALKGHIEGLEEIKVITDGEETSTHDILLVSVLRDKESFLSYMKDEKHIHAGMTYIVPYTKNRACVDYEE